MLRHPPIYIYLQYLRVTVLTPRDQQVWEYTMWIWLGDTAWQTLIILPDVTRQRIAQKDVIMPCYIVILNSGSLE